MREIEIAKSRQVRAEQTRQTIVRAAAETFDRFGYGTATVGDIIAQAGVTKGALYFHFQSKEELAQTVIDAQHERSVDWCRKLLVDQAPGLVSVIRLSQQLTHQMMRDPIVRAGIRLALEAGTFDMAVVTPYREWLEVTEKLLKRSSQEGDLRPELVPETLARFIVGSFTGVQMISHVLAGRADLEQQVRDMWEILLPALVPKRKLPYFRSTLLTGSVGLADDHAEMSG
ncbi:TetR/AcrR family transcriptional regulator [Actinomadura graeca]|uniref:TetR/AcrR family transcriptional regulator n=1 Tax=Actinomadura graeca TaxID=2750812 RepID=A0ABX8QV76_9ACTN|nr:ScbR family autoregulator-binding transcription factor [Actinomadura graeca]QXJ22636.1 TetR/AcrR family transcriptional regulator [Actinomadura graeca]